MLLIILKNVTNTIKAQRLKLRGMPRRARMCQEIKLNKGNIPRDSWGDKELLRRRGSGSRLHRECARGGGN